MSGLCTQTHNRPPCAYAARAVRSGAIAGLCYRDFTICMTDETAYRLPMQTLFSRAGIPFYCASSAPVAQNPAHRSAAVCDAGRSAV